MSTPEEYELIGKNKAEMEKISKRLEAMTKKIHGEPPTEPIKEKKAK
jgi:hypothetical protein